MLNIGLKHFEQGFLNKTYPLQPNSLTLNTIFF